MRLFAPLLLLSTLAAAGELFNKRVAIVEEFPRHVVRGKSVDIRGKLQGAFRAPELILIAPNGKTYLNADQEIGERSFVFHVKFSEGAGPYRMELVAHKHNSTKSAARFTIHYARKPSRAAAEPPPPEGDITPLAIHPRLIEKRFHRRLNEFRKEIRVKPVGWNEAIASRARTHVRRMAEAERRLHRFGGVGVAELMARRGPASWSGEPNAGWDSLSDARPFQPQTPQSPGTAVRNGAVTFVAYEESLEKMFERYFVREAAWRICAADPYCTEVGVGAARTPRRKKDDKADETARPPVSPFRVWYCIVFVQINDKSLISSQNRGYSALLDRARNREPDYLRHVGVWGRRTGWTLLDGASRDEDAEVGGAGLDGMLLLDEAAARRRIESWVRGAELSRGRGHYGLSATRLAPLRHMIFDWSFRDVAERARKEAERAAGVELARVLELKEPKRREKLEELLKRTAGLEIEATVRQALTAE